MMFYFLEAKLLVLTDDDLRLVKRRDIFQKLTNFRKKETIKKYAFFQNLYGYGCDFSNKYEQATYVTHFFK